jgi:hypothetical protein
MQQRTYGLVSLCLYYTTNLARSLVVKKRKRKSVRSSFSWQKQELGLVVTAKNVMSARQQGGRDGSTKGIESYIEAIQARQTTQLIGKRSPETVVIYFDRL